MGSIKRILVLSISLVFISGTTSAGSYEEEVSEWKSYEDVANWLENNFSFDRSRQKKVIKRLREDGPEGLLARNPSALYEDSSGYCVDSSNFAISTLNKINPAYNARWIFIENAKGRPNHWATAFNHEGKLYIMDFGAGKKWDEMNGLHGPYASLDGYRDYLSSLDLPRFELGDVYFREMPGEED